MKVGSGTTVDCLGASVTTSEPLAAAPLPPLAPSSPASRDVQPTPPTCDAAQHLGRAMQPPQATSATAPVRRAAVDQAGVQQQVSATLGGSLALAAALHEAGDEAAARDMLSVLHILAPGAVPSGLGQANAVEIMSVARGFGTRGRVVDGPLADITGTLHGDAAAERSFALAVAEGPLVPAAAYDTSRAPEPATQVLVSVWHGNDSLVGKVVDGLFRGDDRATADFGAAWTQTAAETQRVVAYDQQLFTEVQPYTSVNGKRTYLEPRPMRRVDYTRLMLESYHTESAGRWYFDSVTVGKQLHLIHTGRNPLVSGVQIQNSYHGESGHGRTVGHGLQDDYTAENRFGVGLGASIAADKSLGLLGTQISAGLLVPIGTGVGHATSGVAVYLGNPARGFHAGVGADATYQWAQGQAFAFDGAPNGGIKVAPRLFVGWQAKRWGVGFEISNNTWGTQDGAGDKRGQTGTLTIYFGSGPRKP